jgi:hypothetical protein
MELDNLYQEVILDHYKRPQNKKLSLTYDAQVHHVNPSCGDEIDLNLSIVDGVVTNISWDGVGCSISQASVSIGERGGGELDVVNFVGSNGRVDRSPELRECPAPHFNLSKLGPATPRGLNGEAGLNQESSGLCSLKS